MGLGKSRRQASGVEYCWPDRSLGWQKGLEWAVVGETMQFVEEGETSYCAAVLKGGQPCAVANDVEGFALDPVKAGGGGCDSCSAFAGKGKATTFQLAMQSTEFRESLSALGSAFKLAAGVQQKCEKFVCAMYGGSPSNADVNELRCKPFCMSSSPSSQLSSNRNALQKHIQCVNLQTAVWRRCLDARPDVMSPDQHGWIVKDNHISIDWMDGNPVPEELLVLTKCSCNSGCSSNRCSCRTAGLPCTDACKFSGCDNMQWSAAGELGDTEDTMDNATGKK